MYFEKQNTRLKLVGVFENNRVCKCCLPYTNIYRKNSTVLINILTYKVCKNLYMLAYVLRYLIND